MDEKLLREALQYLDPETETHAFKCQGVVIGMVTALMANGYSFIGALEIVNRNLPNVDIPLQSWPVGWQEQFMQTAFKRITR